MQRLHWILLMLCCGCACAFAHKIQKRFLLFPRQAPTRHQFIAGIGIPADLDYESLVVGHVLKAQFFLPFNATVFRQNPFFPEYKVASSSLNAREMLQLTQRSQLRWDIYSYIIDRLDNYGYNGEACLLRTICEANTLHLDRNFSVFAELLHILLSPSTSLDAENVSKHKFVMAEKLGHSAKSNSCNIYDCKLSLLDLVSTVLHVNF